MLEAIFHIHTKYNIHCRSLFITYINYTISKMCIALNYKIKAMRERVRGKENGIGREWEAASATYFCQRRQSDSRPHIEYFGASVYQFSWE